MVFIQMVESFWMILAGRGYALIPDVGILALLSEFYLLIHTPHSHCVHRRVRLKDLQRIHAIHRWKAMNLSFQNMYGFKYFPPAHLEKLPYLCNIYAPKNHFCNFWGIGRHQGTILKSILKYCYKVLSCTDFHAKFWRDLNKIEHFTDVSVKLLKMSISAPYFLIFLNS